MRRSIIVLMTAAACAVWAAAPASAATTWAIQATPNPADAVTPVLNGVSCPSTTSCFAVGADNNAVSLVSQTLAEHWNGSAWTVQATPNPSGSLGTQLLAVACPSVKSCIAVGQNTGSSGPSVVLAERWNGSTWAIMTVPNPSDATLGSSLSGISCTSATSCTVVGNQDTNDGQHPLAEHWNGSTWTIQATPIPSGSDESQLDAVSCGSATSCAAVGVFSGPSYLVLLAEHWNGSTWTIQTTPNPAGANPDSGSVSFLTSVSCNSATSCTALGFADRTAGTAEQVLAEHWNGSTWTIQTTPDPAGADQDDLTAVSCVSATACTATGIAGSTADTNSSTLAERWNGSTWTIQATPDPADASASALYGVACVSTTTCIAVGSSDAGTLVEQSNS
jgi:hypothetical protein